MVIVIITCHFFEEATFTLGPSIALYKTGTHLLGHGKRVTTTTTFRKAWLTRYSRTHFAAHRTIIKHPQRIFWTLPDTSPIGTRVMVVCTSTWNTINVINSNRPKYIRPTPRYKNEERFVRLRVLHQCNFLLAFGGVRYFFSFFLSFFTWQGTSRNVLWGEFEKRACCVTSRVQRRERGGVVRTPFRSSPEESVLRHPSEGSHLG